jgi:hypothetical protein
LKPYLDNKLVDKKKVAYIKPKKKELLDNGNETCQKHEPKTNLAKLDCGLNQSPTIMVGKTKQNKKLGKNRGIPNPSWILVKTKSISLFLRLRSILGAQIGNNILTMSEQIIKHYCF